MKNEYRITVRGSNPNKPIIKVNAPDRLTALDIAKKIFKLKYPYILPEYILPEYINKK